MGGRWGHGVHVGGGGGAVGWWVGARARRTAVRSAQPQSVTVRPTGRRSGRGWPKSAGEPGALEVSGGAQSAPGPAPPSAGMNPTEHHPRGRTLVEAGGSATPSPRGQTRPGRAPPEGYRGGGRGGAPGLRGPGPWWLSAGAGETGRASGLRLVRGGVEGPGGLGGERREAPGGWARAPEGGRSLRGGGGCSLPGGRRGPLMSEGGGRACIARCRAMSIHGRLAWDYIPNPPRRSPFFGGEWGGGGWRLLCAPSHVRGGGVASGSSVRLGQKNPVASPGLVGPFEEEPRIRRGGLR